MAAEPLLRDQLRKTFPDGGARAAFINRVLAASDEQLVRVLALKRLKDRYPAAAESELDDATRQKLHALVDDHLVHLRKQSALFAMSLEAIVDLPAEPPRGEAASWQQQAEAAYRSIEAIDQLCTELLSGAPRTTRDAAQSLRLLQASYQALRSALDLR